MCFSAAASFVAGGSLGLIGGSTLKKTREKSEIPFALMPLLFGIQQCIEGTVWLSFYYHWEAVNMVATYGFMMFSHVLWPFFAPLAFMLMEKDAVRKKTLQIFTLIGALVSLYLFYSTFGHAVSSVVGNSIVYSCSLGFPTETMAIYLFTSTISAFFSSSKSVNVFGMTLLISFAISFFFYRVPMLSVWCFFAAILSVQIYNHFVMKYENISLRKKVMSWIPQF